MIIYLTKRIQNFGLPRWCSSKESTCQYRRCGLDPWVRKIPWRRKWQSIPIFLPGKFHKQRSLAGYSPWGHKESDATKHAHTPKTLFQACKQWSKIDIYFVIIQCIHYFTCMKVKSESEVAQSCLTFCNPRNCSPPGSSIHGIF